MKSLKENREELHLPFSLLSELTLISTHRLKRMENGETYPTLDEVERLEKIIGKFKEGEMVKC